MFRLRLCFLSCSETAAVRDAVTVKHVADCILCAQMKKLARRQNEDSQQSGTKDKKSGSAAVSKNSSKRSSRDDDALRQ